jgi:hypothetical protein
MEAVGVTRMGCVYMFTFLDTGKHYIGKTIAANPARRWNTHLRDAAKGSDLLLHRAMRKHEGRFVVEVLWSGPEAALAAKEIEYIALVGSCAPKGYNLTPGGDGISANPAVACKIALKAKERMKDPTVRAAMSERSVAMYGTPKGDDVRRRISETLKGRKLPKQVCLNHSLGGQRRYSDLVERMRTSEAARIHYDSPAGAQTRRKQSEASKGRRHTEEARRKISEAATLQHTRRRALAAT